MAKTYSTCEAKARFSGAASACTGARETVTVTYHGEPVAEVRPVRPARSDLDARIRDLHEASVLADTRWRGTLPW